MRIAKIHLVSAPIVSADDGVGHVFLGRLMLSRLSPQPVFEMKQRRGSCTITFTLVIASSSPHNDLMGLRCGINRYDGGRKVAAFVALISGREMRKNRSEDVLNTLNYLKIFERV
jgi:hypothetical protein